VSIQSSAESFLHPVQTKALRELAGSALASSHMYVGRTESHEQQLFVK